MTTEPILTLENVSIGYDPAKAVIENLSFSLMKGEKIALMGANGAGKSTLLKALIGLIPYHSGRIQVKGLNLPSGPAQAATLKAVRAIMGYTFQEVDDQLFMNTVYDDVAFGPRNQGLHEDAVKERVQQALSTVGQLHNSHRPPYKLSGGEKRAVAIATVLSMTPEILLMDEPESGLDGFSRKRLASLLKSLDHAVLFTTHDLTFAKNVADRIILLNDGQIVLEGESHEVLAQTETLEAYHIL